MSDIRGKIWKAKNNFHAADIRNGVAEIILMTPLDEAKLIEEIAGDNKLGAEVSNNGHFLIIWGMKVYRTRDIKEGEFIVK